MVQTHAPMQRIMIIGNSGAGKSTLARELADRLKLDLIYLDQHHWRPGWIRTPKLAWEKEVRQLAAQEKWVIDGNYTGTMAIRLNRADTIIFLDRSRWVCLWNVLKRTVYYYGKRRPDLGPGCPDRLSWSFLQFIFYYNRDFKPRALKHLANKKPDTKLIVLKKQREINEFLKMMDAS